MELLSPSNGSSSWTPARASETITLWRRLLRLGLPQRYEKRSVLFSQGDQQREVFLITDGIVKLEHVLPDGTQTILGLRYPGHLVGHYSHDLKAHHPISALTVLPSEVHRVDAKRIRRIEAENPGVSELEKRMLRQEIHELATSLVQLKLLSPAQLVERLLSDLAAVMGARRRRKEAERFVLPLCNAEMAEILGLSESHYKQVRRSLEQAGRLRRDRRQILFLKRN